MNVWIYIDGRKQVGEIDHLTVFESQAAAGAWFRTHEHPEGATAARYPVHRALGPAAPSAWRKKILVYVDTSKDVSAPHYLVVFEDVAAANAWFKKHDPAGVAFEYEVSE